MKKISFLFLALAALMLTQANAQMIGGSTDAVVQRPKPAPKVSAPAADVGVKTGVSEEDIKAITEKVAAEPPVAMTPEQKAEIDLAAKKSVRASLKKQSVRDRKDFIDVMTTAEKVQKRRAALLEGKTDEEAVKAEAEVEIPDVNPAKDAEMEQYLYQRAGLVNEQ